MCIYADKHGNLPYSLPIISLLAAFKDVILMMIYDNINSHQVVSVDVPGGCHLDCCGTGWQLPLLPSHMTQPPCFLLLIQCR